MSGFVSSKDELPASFDEARPNLRPKIWPRATFTELQLRQRIAGGKEIDVPLYLLGSHLVTTVVYDLPNSMRSLSQEDFENWNVSYYEAMEAACENLKEASVAYSKIGDGFYSAVSGDSYHSSRILLKDQIAEWDVVGDKVAMVPQRDSLFVTGSEDDVSLKIMLSLTETTIAEQPRPLCPIPLRLVDDEWEDWMVPRSHELYRSYKDLEANFLGGLYADQKSLLDQLHEKDGVDIFVASFSGIKKESTGETLSYCLWSKGVDTLLPKTQLLMLGAGQESVSICEWERVFEVVGDLMELDDDLYPARYRVTEFPSDAQIAEIGTIEP